jgi:carboxylate-amine ligase
MEFKASQAMSVGLEQELQLLDASSLDLANGILPLMELYPDSPYVKPEFIQNTVEVTSKVCHTLRELEDHLRAVVSDVRSRCQELGMALCGAGSHPFCKRLAIITPLPRYVQIGESAGYLGRTQITFATHVHIGMSSGEAAIAAMRDLKPYLPLLLALSASSPFWRGYDTGYVSYRHRILAATRSYGTPPSFQSWKEFSDFFVTTRQAGVFDTINDIHWDIRPRPHLGTLEVRVMDAQSSVSEAIALAGFVRALIVYLERTRGTKRPRQLPQPLPWWSEKENNFQASRLGLGASYVKDEHGSVVRLADLFHAVCGAVAGIAEELGQSAYLERLVKSVASGLSHIRQRRVFEQSGSLKQVVSTLAEALEH